MITWLSEEKTIQEKKLFILQNLEEAKTWRSEIPEQLIHSISDNTKYKIRRARFGGIVQATEYICNHILTDKKYELVKKELKDKSDFFVDDNFKKRLATKEDIERGDATIERLLNVLQDIE